MNEQRIAELEQHVSDELVEARERGCDSNEIDEAARHFEDLKKQAGTNRGRHYETILDILGSLEPVEDFPYEEPSNLEDIKSSAQGKVQARATSVSEDELRDKVLGTWLGRCAGCILGKPVEGRSREYIRRILHAADAYPLDGYFPEIKHLPEGCEDYKPDGRLLRGAITHVVRDDDIDYTVLNLLIAERHGCDFSAEDVAREWLGRLPYSMLYTAERIAYANCVNGITPPASAFFRNPYREWIGAQIRADVWGYICPGMPQRAAELAFRDASVSHTSNGIYGEMFFAAAIAEAFITQDISQILNAGLAVVPARSRFAEVVNDALACRKQHDAWEPAFDEMMKKWGSYHCIHTLKNAAIVLLALLYGDIDYEKTVSIAVMCGEDTDCNGATAGSAMGALLGAERIPAIWTECLNDRVESSVSGHAEARISELAKRTFDIARSCTS